MDSYKAMNGCVLVELSDNLEYVDVPDKQYATKTSGIIKSMADDLADSYQLLNKKVWFKDFEDGVQVEINGKPFAFIKFEELRGYFEQIKP